MQYLTNFYRNRCELLERRYQQLAHQYRLLQEDVRITPPDLGIGGDNVYSGSGGEFWWENPLGTGEPPPFPYVPGSLSGERYMNPWWNQGFGTTQTPGGGPVLDVLYDDDAATETFADRTEEELLAMFGPLTLKKIRELFFQWSKRNPGVGPLDDAARLRFLKEYWRDRQKAYREFVERFVNNASTAADKALFKQYGVHKGVKGYMGHPDLPGANGWPRGVSNNNMYVIDPDTGRIYRYLDRGYWIEYTNSTSPEFLIQMFREVPFNRYPGQPGHGGGPGRTPFTRDQLPENWPYNLPQFENWQRFQQGVVE